MTAQAQAPQMTPRQMNLQRRTMVLNNSVNVIQKIGQFTQATAAYVAGQATVLNIPPQNVGLIKRFIIKVTANVAQSVAETHTRSPLGPANFLSQIILTDLNNLVRVNTSGWHLSMLASARRRMAFGAAFSSDTPMGIGANLNVVSAPAAVTVAANLFMMYEIPVSYSDDDLRGGIFANVVNSTMNLQLTINPNLSVAVTGDETQACYKSSTAALMKINSYTIEVYQEYLDQLPKTVKGDYILPQMDMQMQYMIQNAAYSGLVVGADYPLPYANFRQYLSTFVMFDNAGVLNAGTDINYFALQTANSMNVFKYDPFIATLQNGRMKINDDWPRGVYYFDHRMSPIDTQSFGNMQLNVNPISVGANSQLVAGYEFMAIARQLQGAGSLRTS